jgi:hypothetical protein
MFGSYWDDETTRGEREWLDAHFAGCAGCRAEYESLARTLAAVASLPRAEAAPDLAQRALAAARRSEPTPDVVFVRETPRWVPALAASAAAFVLVAGLAPFLLRGQGPGEGLLARRPAVTEPRLTAVANPPAGQAGGTPAAGTRASGALAAAISDSLFDHSEDVDFVLDPVTLHRGRAHTASRLPRDVQGEQAVITF